MKLTNSVKVKAFQIYQVLFSDMASLQKDASVSETDQLSEPVYGCGPLRSEGATPFLNFMMLTNVSRLESLW